MPLERRTEIGPGLVERVEVVRSREGDPRPGPARANGPSGAVDGGLNVLGQIVVDDVVIFIIADSEYLRSPAGGV
jgi:hypothetical protein